MLLHEIQSSNKNARARVGRGGKRGTTSGRGQKGQKAHAGRRIHPAVRDLIQRLPKLRGYKNKPIGKKAPVINVGDLDAMKEIPRGVKVLGTGEVTKAVTIYGTASKVAREKIEKAGGTIK